MPLNFWAPGRHHGSELTAGGIPEGAAPETEPLAFRGEEKGIGPSGMNSHHMLLPTRLGATGEPSHFFGEEAGGGVTVTEPPVVTDAKGPCHTRFTAHDGMLIPGRDVHHFHPRTLTCTGGVDDRVRRQERRRKGLHSRGDQNIGAHVRARWIYLRMPQSAVHTVPKAV